MTWIVIIIGIYLILATGIVVIAIDEGILKKDEDD